MKKTLMILTLTLIAILSACGSTSEATNLEEEARRHLDELLVEITSTVEPIEQIDTFEWICTEIDADNTYFIDCTYLIEMNEDVYIVAYMLTDNDGHFVEAQQAGEEQYMEYYQEIYQAVVYLEQNPEEARANHTTLAYGSFEAEEILNLAP